MAIVGKASLSDYIKAFAHFGGLNKIFHTRAFGRHALVNDGVNIYQVSRFDDLLADYHNYFKGDYQEVYTMFPAELWAVFLKEKVTLSEDDLIIELYKGWKSYWRAQVGIKEKKASSLNDFNEMVNCFQKEGNILEAADKIDGPVLIPVIAISVKQQYPKTKDFLTDCVRLMTQRYVDQIGDGHLFVKVGPEGYPDDQTYFIYTVDEEF